MRWINIISRLVCPADFMDGLQLLSSSLSWLVKLVDVLGLPERGLWTCWTVHSFQTYLLFDIAYDDLPETPYHFVSVLLLHFNTSNSILKYVFFSKVNLGLLIFSNNYTLKRKKKVMSHSIVYVYIFSKEKLYWLICVYK